MPVTHGRYIGYYNKRTDPLKQGTQSKEDRLLHKRLREEAGGCQDCGRSGCRLEVHHVDLNRKNRSLGNLRVLCRSCHQKTHHALRRMAKPTLWG